MQALDFDYLVTGHSTALEPKSNLENYISVAMNPDIEKASDPGKTEFAPNVKPMQCMDKGNRGKKRKSWNKAAIVISADKL